MINQIDDEEEVQYKSKPLNNMSQISEEIKEEIPL